MTGWHAGLVNEGTYGPEPHHIPYVEGRDVWMEWAACTGVTPVMYPGRGQDSAVSKRICRECAVIDLCLEYALVHGEKFGTWGGLSERERRPLRRARNLAEKVAS